MQRSHEAGGKGSKQIEREKMESEKTNKKKKGVAAVIAAILIAACAGGAWYVHDSKIKEMQNAGVEKLQASVNLDAYREAEQKEINAILEETETAIRDTGDQAEIDALIEKAVAETEGLKTAAAYTQEEGIEKLKKSVDTDLYREAEQKEIKKILDSTEKAILKTGDQAEIDALIKKAGDKIGELKTDEEYTAEEEAARQAAASKSGKKKKKPSGSGGCIGGGSDVWN